MITTPSRRRSIVAAAALSVVTALVLVATPRVAGASPSWSAVNPTMPSDAVAGQGVSLLSASCPADGWCVAVGNYMASSGSTYYDAGLIDAQSGGTWSATEAPLPPGASGSDPQAILYAVQCPAVGTCVAVGEYTDSSGATQALVEQLSKGQWTPSELALPGDALTSGPSAFAQLSNVVCPASGSCEAYGLYTQGSGGEQALVTSDSGGSWSATALPATSPTTLLSMSCPAVGSCVAAGTTLQGSTWVGVADTLSGGTWSGTALPLPAGTSSAASIADGYLSVTCASVGDCTVAGTTFDGNFEGLLDTLSGGTWTASPAPLPGGVSSPDVQLSGLSCADAADCVATGFFTSSGVEQGLIETLVSGTWNASQAPVPAGTLSTTGIDVLDVACPSAGNCVADGQSNAQGTVNGLLWNLSGGAWTVTATPLPSDAGASSDPMFAPFTCPGTGVCLEVGTYVGTASAGREGVVETDPSLAATTTSVSAQSTSSGELSYSATVTGSSPTGTVVFSAGLDDLCTAVISGATASCTGPVPPSKQILGSYSGDGVNAPSWGTAASPDVPAAISDVSPFTESTRINSWFPRPLSVQITGANGQGVAGIPVTFIAPTSGPSVGIWGPSTVVTNAAGVATSPYLSSNSKVGSYIVWAVPAGEPFVTYFVLTNTRR
jgi:hypothetical protein